MRSSGAPRSASARTLVPITSSSARTGPYRLWATGRQKASLRMSTSHSCTVAGSHTVKRAASGAVSSACTFRPRASRPARTTAAMSAVGARFSVRHRDPGSGAPGRVGGRAASDARRTGTPRSSGRRLGPVHLLVRGSAEGRLTSVSPRHPRRVRRTTSGPRAASKAAAFHPSVVFVDSANAPVAWGPDATAVPDGYGLMPGDTVTADVG